MIGEPSGDTLTTCPKKKHNRGEICPGPLHSEHIRVSIPIQDAHYQSRISMPTKRKLANSHRSKRNLLACTNQPKIQKMFSLQSQRPDIPVQITSLWLLTGPMSVHSLNKSNWEHSSYESDHSFRIFSRLDGYSRDNTSVASVHQRRHPS